MERHHRRILHRWFARSTRRLQVDAQRCDIVRHPSCRYRRCLNWIQPHDGRQHQARGPTATTHRRRRSTKRRPCSACVNLFFDIMAQKWEFFNFQNVQHGIRMKRMLSGWFAFTVGQVRLRSAFALSSASVLYLVSYTDMICTTSGGVSRRRHELMESCSIPRFPLIVSWFLRLSLLTCPLHSQH